MNDYSSVNLTFNLKQFLHPTLQKCNIVSGNNVCSVVIECATKTQNRTEID